MRITFYPSPEYNLKLEYSQVLFLRLTSTFGREHLYPKFKAYKSVKDRDDILKKTQGARVAESLVEIGNVRIGTF